MRVTNLQEKEVEDMTGLEVIAALGGIAAVIGLVKGERNRENDLETIALKALSEAVTLTEGFSARQTLASDEANFELTNAWHIASLSFRDAGYPEMQELCQLKGEYWLDPSRWTKEQVREAGILLVDMRRRLNNVLSLQ
jgi:hypothetical protein